jgi:hypothetical protein
MLWVRRFDIMLHIHKVSGGSNGWRVESASDLRISLSHEL